jgi:signal transduction histidine kinase
MSTLQLNQLFSIKQVGVSTAGTEGEQGSGIGMILVKELIERNNGKISIDSELGRGTTVTLELPVKQTR